VRIPNDASSSKYIRPGSSVSIPRWRISSLTKNPKIGSRLNILVETTFDLEQCYCVAISKGKIVKNVAIDMINNEGILSFIPDFTYAPTTRFVFFYYEENQNIKSIDYSISFEDSIPNYLDLELSSTNVKPGTSLKLNIESARGSKVSLMAMDQRILLLQTGNDLENTDVTNSLSPYNRRLRINSYYRSNEYRFELSNLFLMEFKLLSERRSEETPEESSTETPEDSSTETPQEFSGEIPEESSSEIPEDSSSETPEDSSSETPEESSGETPEDSSGNGGSERAASPRVRRDFNETFLWDTVVVSEAKRDAESSSRRFQGETELEFVPPDTITSYVISGVSMHRRFGLGLPIAKPELTVFMPFFILLNLPHHIKRGEILEQDIFIFNYLTKGQCVVVTVKRDDAAFAVENPEFDGWEVESDMYWQQIRSEPNVPVKLRLVIRPVVLGYINLVVEAVGYWAGDKVLKTLNVVPEGILNSITKSVLIMKEQSTSTMNLEASLTCALPTSAVEDTTSTAAFVVGDLMGDALNNLERLIRQSYGCGEQNMINFVPNIMALIYLDATEQLTERIRSNAIRYAEDGYQRQLRYRRFESGSFSGFGNGDRSGSTWLTAYVVKSFLEAKDYITIDSIVITQAFTFLVSKQNGDGSFREDGRVFNKNLQGGSSGKLTMTAYISIILSENIAKYPSYISARKRSLNYIKNYINDNIDTMDAYSLAICSYALLLEGEDSHEISYQKLLTKKTETGDHLYWTESSTIPENDKPWWWYQQPRSNDIEMTAYALLLIQRIDIAKAVKIAAYLTSQKNSYGGYGSSQDTVVALGALAEFAARVKGEAASMNLQLTPDRGSEFNVEKDPDDKLNRQSFTLDKFARKLDVFTLEGSRGVALTPEDSSVETPTDSSVETTEDSSVETPEDSSVETPTDSSVETPEDNSLETPEDSSLETPEDSSVETPEGSQGEQPTPEETLETPEEFRSITPQSSEESTADIPEEGSVETTAEEFPEDNASETESATNKSGPYYYYFSNITNSVINIFQNQVAFSESTNPASI
ncbi:CLUMA_CG008712, isoform A, partial [Clunio marinus]